MLKSCVEKIDRGGGILALYDMEFLRQMLSSVSFETGIEIRSIFSALTALSIEWSRRAALTTDLHALFTVAQDGINGHVQRFSRAIVTLCTTGTGAEELKTYIERHGDIGDAAVIPLSMADGERLKTELSDIQHNHIISCLVGAQDPHMMGIPFISVSDVLGCDPKLLPEVLRGKNREKRRIDTDEVFAYLDEQLTNVDSKKLRRIIPPMIERFNAELAPMSIDTETGLLLHIACTVNRLCGGIPAQRNPLCQEIINSHKKEYETLKREIRPLEKAFHIILPDDELANILMILYKL